MSDPHFVTLEVFTDYVCPWCYLASDSVAKLEAIDPDVEIQWTPFPLHPDTPGEGLDLRQLLGPNLDQIHQRLFSIMDEVGLPYAPQRVMTYNSRMAQELGMWGNNRENGKDLHKALYRAYFVENKNISEKQVLLDVVSSVGMDAHLASEVLENRTFSNAVDEAWQRARAMNISGVPSFIGGRYLTTGYQSLENLQQFIDHVRIAQSGA